MTDPNGTTPPGVSRRAVNVAAWTVPVVAVALASPASAASSVDVGAFTVTGSCGTPGILGPGFRVVAGSGDLPVGTTILINGTGVRDIGVFKATPAIAFISVLSGTARQATLTSALPAGTTLALRTNLSTSTQFTLNAVASLPDGYAGTGSKASGTAQNTFVGCSES
ncbi:hypothetical protein [Rathayibacter sp. VKM Ac-2927]|uniref:hypothetical protein n=1 Tax=Rathayibacter sp. VKM Ac-2927 TaxID=2929478 RepID=UPI001FB47DFD|nr:hypothetical protein [Rathayibacter sp. VKM Ac-2927]MCJ1688621.1 hypothetical protein [Rathayibacter sp. VKM Ac-2927]